MCTVFHISSYTWSICVKPKLVLADSDRLLTVDQSLIAQKSVSVSHKLITPIVTRSFLITFNSILKVVLLVRLCILSCITHSTFGRSCHTMFIANSFSSICLLCWSVFLPFKLCCVICYLILLFNVYAIMTNRWLSFLVIPAIVITDD